MVLSSTLVPFCGERVSLRWSFAGIGGLACGTWHTSGEAVNGSGLEFPTRD